MKKIALFSALMLLLTLTACKKRKEINVTSFTVEQTDYYTIEFTYSSDGDPIYYEVSVGKENNAESGKKLQLSPDGSDNPSVGMLDIDPTDQGPWYFFLRAYNPKSKAGPWSEVKTLTLGSPCQKPYDLAAWSGSISMTFSWETYSNTTTTTSYEVEYGPTGFTQGSGEKISTNSMQTKEAILDAGTTYDFYVRGLCTDGLGWSDWAGPLSYYVDQNYNHCDVPTGMSYTVSYNFFGEATGAQFEWDYNGEYGFEYVVVSDGNSPESGTINTYESGFPLYSLTQNTDYDFYVRTLCVDGGNSAWAGPLNVNIGE
ncbi:MAG: hypothetical protein MI810_17665 [Flavobacteriales bacterium]|nr:hypothetical protein [Flavobacteriales bacterium]